MKRILQISARFALTGTAFLIVFCAGFWAVIVVAAFFRLGPFNGGESTWLPLFVLVILGFPGVAATLAARGVDRRVFLLLHDSFLRPSLKRKLKILLVVGYVATAVFGSPAALTTGHREALEGFLNNSRPDNNNSTRYHPYIAGFAAVPVLPGIILTYEEHQTGMRAGSGGFRLYLWYGKDASCIGNLPFWVS